MPMNNDSNSFFICSKEFYDESGKKTSELRGFLPKPLNISTNKVEFKYDGDRLIEEIEIDREYEGHTYFDYNSAGKVIKRRYTNTSEERQLDSAVNTLDAKGNVIRTVCFENGDSTGSRIFKYDENNNLIETVTFDDTETDRRTYTYKDGLLMEAKTIRKRRATIDKYRYDGSKNLTEEKKYFDDSDQPFISIRYEYEYY